MGWRTGIIPSAEESDPGINLDDLNDEELYYTSSSLPKIQIRSDVSKAQWNDDMRMAVVVEKKGKFWVTTGIVRGSKTLCSVEETLFLVEIGALLLTDPDGTSIPTKHLYAKVTEEHNGSCSELFEVYKHLKTLGYIVGRHGVPWSTKSSVRNRSNSNYSQDASTNLDTTETELKDVKSIEEMLRNLTIDELTPAFDVFLPNSKFRKSSPGDPDFVVILIRGNPPSIQKIGVVKKQFDGTPLKFCHVEHGRVNFFVAGKRELACPTMNSLS